MKECASRAHVFVFAKIPKWNWNPDSAFLTKAQDTLREIELTQRLNPDLTVSTRWLKVLSNDLWHCCRHTMSGITKTGDRCKKSCPTSSLDHLDLPPRPMSVLDT